MNAERNDLSENPSTSPAAPGSSASPAGNGATGPYRVVATLLTIVVVGGLGYGLVQTAVKAAAIFGG